MNLEKLGLLVFLKHYQQLDLIRGHVASSVKELLLATSESLDLTQKLTAQNAVLKKFETLDITLKMIQGLVAQSANQIKDKSSATTDIDVASVKKEMISSLIAAVNEEIEKVSDSTEENKQAKLDALMTVRHVFLKQTTQENQNSAAQEDILNLERASNE